MYPLPRLSLLPLFAILLLVVLVSGCRSATSASATTSEAKIVVEEDGIYALSYADLADAGLDLSEVDPGTIQLLNRGEEVPLAHAGQAADLMIMFYGEENDGPYSPENIYWLSIGREEGKVMAQRAVSSDLDETTASSFLHTVYLEEDSFYAAKVPLGEDHWYWQKTIAPGSISVSVRVSHPAHGDGTLRFSVLGYTSDPVDPDHHLRIHFNDCSVGEESWDGQGQHLVETFLPASCLQDGENSITVEAVGDTGAQADIVLVDWIEVDYPRLFIAEENRLEFSGQSGAHTLTGFTDNDIWLFDITDPLSVVLVTGAAVDGSGQDYSISFVDEEPPGRRYVAISEAGLKTPSSIAPLVERPDLRSSENQADYMVITHEEFREAIQPLVEWRTGRGLEVNVVSITDVYDEFSYGLVDPAAIRDFLRHAYGSWSKPAPQYVLLVGDASYDFRNNLGGPNRNLLPSSFTETAYSGQTTSDNWFVSVDDADNLPDMAIGRLPVQTAEEVRAVVDKIINYEKNAPPGEWRRRLVLVADGQGETFAEQSALLAREWIPSGYDLVKVYASSLEDPKTRVRQELSAGGLIVNYVGHGSIDTWSREKLFSSEQITSLENDGRQPFVVMMSCLLGFFAHPERQSMAEELLIAENGGAVAVFAPSSLTLSSDQAPLNQALFDALLVKEVPTVGVAIMDAKRSLEFETQDQRDVIETFSLLGDPALRLVAPE
ncbi:MAG: hypothetical protein GTO63_12185 [Anaerolineae bacterium]|nr:hypothetical protein [Anaerolineae bacterium]NIN95655.1 hypothetical protein [Anaerolineae bacterium]NIQ78610.1 hypothetical protein [Anaerolineae bacterium]